MNNKSKNRGLSKFFLVLLAAALLLSGIKVVKYIKGRYLVLTYTTISREESNLSVDNPYRGFYRMRGYVLTDEAELEDPEREISMDANYKLILLQINLCRYAERDLSDQALKQLDQILSGWARGDRQLILRFVYDWDGRNLETEPKELEQILRHMDQTAETVNRYADHILICQGIFVGNYGEMNNSAYLSRETIKCLLEHWAQITDSSIYLSVRTPAQWRAVTGYAQLPSDFPGFAGNLADRLGLYNDGMLGSATDLGTYGNTSRKQSDDPGAKGNRQEELEFQNVLCQYVPNGGEAVIDNSYNDLENAVQDLACMHVTYLNEDYDPKVIAKWKENVYMGDDCFYGSSGFSYIREHLGYRYSLDTSALEFDTWWDEAATLRFCMRNTGFSSALRSFPMIITCINMQTTETRELSVEADIRELQGGSQAVYETLLPVRELPAGYYELYLKLTDPVSGEQIKLAHNTLPTEAGYLLGKCRIH